MRPIERLIVDAVARMKREGLEPTSIYLTPADLEELQGKASAPPETVGGLAIKRVSGKGSSRLYSRHGVARGLRVRGGRAPPGRRPSPPQSTRTE